MGTMAILALLAVAVVLAVRHFIGTLEHGCCGGGEAVRPVRVRDRDPAHYPYAVRVEIGGMTCRNCRLRVENALNSEEGLWAQVDLAAGSALVQSRHPLSEERLRLVIGREGYTVGAITPA